MPATKESSRRSDWLFSAARRDAMRSAIGLIRMNWLLHRLKAEFAKQFTILAGVRIGRGQKFFTIKDGIGAGQEAEQDSFAAHLRSSCGQTDHGMRHKNAGGSDGPHHDERIEL